LASLLAKDGSKVTLRHAWYNASVRLAFAIIAFGIAGCTPAFETGTDCKNGVDDDGDGLVDCDDPDCALSEFCATCGNGKIDPGEDCDDGFARNGTPGDRCSRYCILATCGNGHVDPGEECDDGNLIPGDGCNAHCKIDHCGDHKLDPEEQCEPSQFDPRCDDQCHAHPPPGCGNGVVDPGEQCDDGNNKSGDGCSADCTLEFCGDAVVESGSPFFEQCDDADPNTPTCSGCRLPVCGNFVVEKGEQCDDGPSNGTPTDPCTADCKLK
jgi:cysteine-rich repeat protein